MSKSGFEPETCGLKVQCSANWAIYSFVYKNTKKIIEQIKLKMPSLVRIEQ